MLVATVLTLGVNSTMNVAQLRLDYQIDSFLFTRLLRFLEVNNYSSTLSICSSIGLVIMEHSYNFKIDTGLLHPLVFEQMYHFDCCGQIKSIQSDIFKHFKILNEIDFYVASLGEFYHQIGIEWMNFVPKNSTIYLKSQFINYTYPNRDFCIFARFPVDLNLQLTLDDQGANSSILYKWLNKQADKIKSDQIKTMIELCEIKGNGTGGSDVYPYYMDYYQSKLTEMLLMELVPFVFIPCACLFGLYLNWIIIRTIKKNEKTELKEDFYKYMSANAKFNCIYCLILVFYPMTSCTWRLSNHFCSIIFTTQFIQYYKIVMIAYFGEVVKMCANITYLMMTLNRYILIGKDHPPWLVTMAKVEFKWLIRGSFILSALINIGHGWEYQSVNHIAFRDEAFYSSAYNEINGVSYSDFPEANQGIHYFVYSVVYFIINFGGFFILNTVIEIKIVRRMHKELKEKRERMAKMNSSNLSAKNSVGIVKATSLSETLSEDKKREICSVFLRFNKKAKPLIVVISVGLFGPPVRTGPSFGRPV
jgi:hypothetical protein